MEESEVLTAARTSLQRLQEFDANTLARTEKLGSELTFSPVVSFSERLIGLYKRVPLSILEDLPDRKLNEIKTVADGDFNRFEEILNFSATQPNAADVRSQLIAQVNGACEGTFAALWQYIAYGVAKVTNTSLLENQARATLQGIADEGGKITGSLKAQQDSADQILERIKSVALEHGVSQQAEFFKREADFHTAAAEVWRNRVTKFAWAVGAYAVVSLLLHKIAWIAPLNNIEAAQLISSKLLGFAVLAYLLVLAARNFLSHTHNAIVNRHRQTALQTYRALADAAHEKGAEDIVLAHAAACIFSPQETGYTKSSSDGQAGSKSVLELLTKASAKID